MNSRRWIKVSFIFTCLLLVATLNVEAFGFGQELGRIDWERGVIIVIGEGAHAENLRGGRAQLMAQRAARVDAYRNAVEFLDGVRVNGQSTMQDMVVSDHVQTQVRGFVQGGIFVDSEYDPNMGISTVTMELPLDGRDGLTYYLDQLVRDNTTRERIDNIEDHVRPEDRRR